MAVTAPLTRIELKNFTVFEDFALDLSPGLNVFIGANGTGKTHLLKVLYAAALAARPIGKKNQNIEDLILECFAPRGGGLEPLIRHENLQDSASIKAFWKGANGPSVILSFREFETVELSDLDDIAFRDQKDYGVYIDRELLEYQDCTLGCTESAIFVPATEILSHARGFVADYDRREIPWDRTFKDIVLAGETSPLRKMPDDIAKILNRIEGSAGGRTEFDNGTFYIVRGDGTRIEYAMHAEGLRKLGLVSLLLRNGLLGPDTVLFWDEPEANLNPGAVGLVCELLLLLQRAGAQIFVATHDDALLREIKLGASEGDNIAYHLLTRKTGEGPVQGMTADRLRDLTADPIHRARLNLSDREIRRGLGR